MIKKFQEIKTISTNHRNKMQDIQDEINSMKAEFDASTKKRAKDFERWKEVMIKKFKYEEANGELGSLSNNESNLT